MCVDQSLQKNITFALCTVHGTQCQIDMCSLVELFVRLQFFTAILKITLFNDENKVVFVTLIKMTN